MSQCSRGRCFSLTCLNLPWRRLRQRFSTSYATSRSSLAARWKVLPTSPSHTSGNCRVRITKRTMPQLSSEGRSRQKPYSTRERSSRYRQRRELSGSRPANWKCSSRCQQLVIAFMPKLSDRRISLSIAKICYTENAPPQTLLYCLNLGVLISSYLAATKRAAMPSSWYRSRVILRPRQNLSVMRTARQRVCWLPQRCRCISTIHPTRTYRIRGEISARHAMKSDAMYPSCSRVRACNCSSTRQGWTSGSAYSHCVEREGFCRLFLGRLGSELRSGRQLVRSRPNILAELRVCTCRNSVLLPFMFQIQAQQQYLQEQPTRNIRQVAPNVSSIKIQKGRSGRVLL